MDEPKPKRKLRTERELLQNALWFTNADLAVNREGQLTDLQVAILRQRRRRGVWSGLTTLVRALFATTLAFGCIFTCLTFSQYLPAATVLVFVPLILVVIFAVYEETKGGWQHPTADLRERAAASVQGLVILDIVETRPTTYRLSIGGLSFDVDKATFNAFKNRDLYNVYYAPHSRTLLSAEPLSETFKRSDDAGDSPQIIDDLSQSADTDAQRRSSQS